MAVKSLPERFWALTDKRGVDDCWPWTGPTNVKGYARLRMRRKGMAYYPATRLAWEIHNDKAWPVGKFACHSCDNPTCVNPAHIWPGSIADNYLDAVAKGRVRGAPVDNALKLACAKGHPLEGANLIIIRGKWRRCRTCQREQQVKWLTSKRESNRGVSP